MSLITTLGTKLRAADSATSALDDLRADLLATLPDTASAPKDEPAADSSSSTLTAAAAAALTPPAASTPTPVTFAPKAAATAADATTAAIKASSSASLSSTAPSTSPTLSFTSLSAALPGPDDTDDDLSWGLGMHSLTAELDSIRHTQNVEHAQLRQHNAALIAADTSGLTALPHNDPAAAAFHSAVIETYDRLSGGQLGLRGKAAFLSRKLKAKQGRAAKRAEEVYEKQTTKLSRGRQKSKARRKAAY